MAKAKLRLKDIILWENENYLLINKPPFLSTLEDRNEELNVLRIVREEVEDAQVCHRLDKDTSGVLAIARHPEAYRHLSIQFEKRTTAKLYHAVADGIHSFDRKLVDAAIHKMPDGTAKISRDGKPAKTFFTSIQAFDNHTHLACEPVTGRMHQIRLHLALLHAPITGDTLYGGKPFFLSSIKRRYNLKKYTEEQPLMKRMALHAFSLGFEDLNGERVQIEAPYPKDMQALLRQLRRS